MTTYQAELYHHGIKGQKWGVRRYQNSDGSLTEAGRRRYEGTKEDAASYKYNKPGESGFAGLKRKRKEKAIGSSNAREGEREDAASYKYNKPGESWKEGLKRKREEETNALKKYGGYEDSVAYKYNKAGESAIEGLKNMLTSKFSKTNEERGRSYVEDIIDHSGKKRNP